MERASLVHYRGLRKHLVINFRSLWYGVIGVVLALAGAANAQNNPVFVLNSLDGNVSVIDPVSWVEKERIPTGKEPHHLYLTPDEKSVIVANALSDSLTFIDPRTAKIQRTVTGILDPYQLRFSPDMKWFVTAANRLNHIDIYRWDGQTPTLAKRHCHRQNAQSFVDRPQERHDLVHHARQRRVGGH